MTSVSDERIVAAIRELGRVAHAVESSPAARAEALSKIDAARSLLADGEPRGGDRRELSTFSGTLNPVAPPMTIRPGTMADGRPALVGTVRLDRLREGPPLSAHGGVIAGLFDELLGGGQRLGGGPPGMTGRLTVRYRRPTPLGEDLELRAWIHDERHRRVTVRGECRVGDAGDGANGASWSGIVTAEAEAVFLRVDFAQLRRVMETRADGETPAPAPPRPHDG